MNAMSRRLIHKIQRTWSHIDECQENNTPLPTIQQTPNPSVYGINETLSNFAIQAEFADLFESTKTHVQRFYNLDTIGTVASRDIIEHATTGLSIPSALIQKLLRNNLERQSMLILVIGWATLSRCLLLKLGMSNSPSSTFLPPEIVECFQAFALGRGVAYKDILDTSQSM